jgi:drug/metabolite transporter (DMT)-like permease
MANATLFGNSGSLILMVWGVIAMNRRPFRGEWVAMGAALAGAVLLMGRSLELGSRTLAGDLFSVAAGLFYVAYLLLCNMRGPVWAIGRCCSGPLWRGCR